jgi:hypothetical protein
MNDNCEFMQSSTHFKNEAQCRASIDIQKQAMIRQAPMKIDLLEGTCITARIEDTRNKA